MSTRPGNNIFLRRMISMLLLAVILSLLLCLYLFKYVPDQRSDFHRRAFLELSQIDIALRERNAAFIDAINNTIDSLPANKIRSNSLASLFQFDLDSSRVKPDTIRSGKRIQLLRPQLTGVDTFSFNRVRLNVDLRRGWRIYYDAKIREPKKLYTASFSKSVDTVLTPIVNTYKDIFEDYLLILDTVTDNSGSAAPQNDYKFKGRVIYNSGHLSVDYFVNLDTLLKKSDGFSLLNIHDVKIEGNPYKLFLYPLQLHNQRVVLAGLISLPNYRQESEAVPIDLITVGSMLILVILLNLPILKIYILGPLERITSMDIRLIINTYFLGTFMTFLLITLVFQRRIGTSNERSNLENLRDSVRNSFYSEIEKACEQLDSYDALYSYLRFRKPGDSLTAAKQSPIDSFLSVCSGGNYAADISNDPLSQWPDTGRCQPGSKIDKAINNLFQPRIYPYAENVFWIDSTGHWTAKWGTSPIYRQATRYSVAERPYFRDIIDHRMCYLPGYPSTMDGFAIQPTLSKINGEYIISITKKSKFQTDEDQQSPANRTDPRRSQEPIIIGLGAQMYSVSNAVTPPGYRFSIIDPRGRILFDSRPGRGLLSNIFVETGDNNDIRQCVNYRYSRFFKSFLLCGREVSLLSSPLQGLPYTLLVYRQLSNEDKFQYHSLILTSFCVGLILLVVALSAFMNEWGRRSPTLVHNKLSNFDWLRPVPGKMDYYHHLIRGMLYLTAVYMLIWCTLEIAFPQQEDLLFMLTLSFPLHIALHYYVVREKYYQEISTDQKAAGAAGFWPAFWQLLKLPFLAPLGFAQMAILLYVAGNKFSENAWSNFGFILIFLLVQFLWILLIAYSANTFKVSRSVAAGTEEDPGSIIQPLIRRYAKLILTGMFLVVFLPASMLFIFFYKEEAAGEARIDKLIMANYIQQRRMSLMERSGGHQSAYAINAALRPLLLSAGVYSYDDIFIPGRPDSPGNSRPLGCKAGIDSSLHDFLFPRDSLSLESARKLESALDNSWSFRKTNEGQVFLQYGDSLSNKRYPGPIILRVDDLVRRSATSLMMKRMGSLRAAPWFLCGLFLMVCILCFHYFTVSLAKHIFLLQLLGKFKTLPTAASPLDEDPACARLISAKSNTASPSCLARIAEIEKCYDGNIENEASLLRVQTDLQKYYDQVWRSLPADERYILYDFAMDEFTNYKAGSLLFKLLDKKILAINDDFRLHFTSPAFQNYLLDKDLFNKPPVSIEDQEVYRYMKTAQKEGSWQAFKVPLRLLLIVVGIFFFFTQEGLFEKVIGLSASLPALVQVIFSLFDRGNGKAAEKADGPTPGKAPDQGNHKVDDKADA